MTRKRTFATLETSQKAVQRARQLSAYMTNAAMADITGLSPSTIRALLTNTRATALVADTARAILNLPIPEGRTIEQNRADGSAHAALLHERGMTLETIAEAAETTPFTIRRMIDRPHTVSGALAARILTVEYTPHIPRERKPRGSDIPWGVLRRRIATAHRAGQSVEELAEAFRLPESRVRDALAGVSGARGISRSWPPVVGAKTRPASRGRAA